MDYSHRLSVSYYKTIAVINETHGVYLVQHQETRKIYVKKLLSVYNTSVYKYLYDHPVAYTPRIIDLYEENSILTVIEEYISGFSMEERKAQGDLTLEEILCFCRELCDILTSLHSCHPPIIHRDVKPSNLIVTASDHVFLLDFNAAKFFTNAESNDTVLLGTKGYAAPEQYGFGSSSPCTDIYSTGILLRELTESLSIPDQLSAVISKCTAMDPADRYQSAVELKNALQALSRPRSLPLSEHALRPDYTSDYVNAPNTWYMTKSENISASTNAPNAWYVPEPEHRSDSDSADNARTSYSAENSAAPEEKHTTPSGLRRFAPPGFRSGNPLKAIGAIMYYLLFGFACMGTTMTRQDGTSVTGTTLTISRICILLAFYAIFFFDCNYLKVQSYFPLARSSNPVIRLAGIILIDFCILVIAILIYSIADIILGH